MRIYAKTQKGRLHVENEDHLIVGRTIVRDECAVEVSSLDGVIAVMDGVGGNNAGAQASRYLADCLAEGKTSVEELTQVNQELIAHSKENPATEGMATTLAMLKLCENGATVTYVGNSRVYAIVSGQYLNQLTVDDTTVQYLLSTGALTPAEAENFERKNEIIACFGAGNPNLLRLKEKPLAQVPAEFMLTSDGVHDHIGIDDLENILLENSDRMVCCRKIVETAVANGSMDDISVIIGVR